MIAPPPVPTLADSLRAVDRYSLTALPNGLRVLTTPLAGRFSVTVAVYVGVGARYESEAHAGVSHFIEHLLFKGSERFPTPRAVGLAVEGVGGSLDAFTSYESTGYIARVPAPHLDTAIDLLADMLRRPRLRPADIDKERRVVQEELSMIYDEPESWVTVQANHLLFGPDPLGRDILGATASVRRMRRETVAAYLAQHYRPNNTVVSIAGAFDPAYALDRLGAAFGDWEPAPTPPYPTLVPLPADAPRLALDTRPIEQAHLRVALRGVARDDPDYYPLQVLCTLLGEGMSSRLSLDLREQAALAYNVYSDDVYFQDTGALGIYAAVEPRRAPKAVAAILGHLRRLRDHLVPAGELAKTREFLKGGLLLGLEDTAEIATGLAGQAVHRDVILTAADLLGHVEAVRAEDIRRVAGRLVTPANIHLAIVGPIDTPEPFEQLIKEAA